ncbi:MAG TPA: DNA adenine methylase [Kofleriaceae bacterium]
MTAAPHPIPYQGSKRRLAAAILRHAPPARRLVEPFAGSAAITLAAAAHGAASRFLLADRLAPLAALWRAILEDPAATARRYRRLWQGQERDPAGHFASARDRFNRTGDPVLLLYLLARCVKNAIRFNGEGAFNQAADHRRRGMHPDRMARHMARAAELLAGRTEVQAADYVDVLADAGASDLVYLDPPYQGVSGGRDPRYVAGVDLPRLVDQLEELNRRQVRYLLSFDGRTGEKHYGVPLPRALGLRRVELAAGRSSQATLSGRVADTVESLYLSPALLETACLSTVRSPA